MEHVYNKVENQGDTFLIGNQYVKGGLEYWREQLNHETDFFKKEEIKHRISVVESGYEFYMVPKDPDSLVMIKNVQSMLPLFKDYPTYIFLG